MYHLVMCFKVKRIYDILIHNRTNYVSFLTLFMYEFSKYIQNASINTVLLRLSLQSSAAFTKPIYKGFKIRIFVKISQHIMGLAKIEHKKETIYYYNSFVHVFNVLLLLVLMP